MKTYANAKVNLALDVIRRRKDGFHDLDMVMLPVDLADEIEIKRADEDIIEFTGAQVPEDNTVTRALAELRKIKPISNYKIRVIKRIPEQAGLAGGSADGAAVLKAVNKLENLGLTESQLVSIAADVGADVPFCVMNRPCRVRGKGELVEPFAMDWNVKFVLVKPEAGVSTPAAFRSWDEDPQPLHDVDLVAQALETGNLELLYSTMANALEPAALDLTPGLEEVVQDMGDAGLVRVMMTGSGSAFMGFSVDEDVLKEAARELSKKYPFVRITKAGGRL